MSTERQVWFITGTSSGLGRSLTEYVLGQGHIVVATLRKPTDLDALKAKYSSEQLLIVKLDVSKGDEVAAAFDKTKEVFGRLDVVVNNAAYGIIGEIESTTEEAARTMFDVNFWGATNISKTAIKFFREVNKPGVGGHLINITSMAGIHPFSTTGFYSASKAALESFTQALLQELDPDWNIKISLVEPGGFKSDGATRSAVILPLHPAYNKPGLPAVTFREYLKTHDVNSTSGDPDKAAAKWFQLAQLPEPPLRLVLGKDAIGIVRAQIDRIVKDVDNFESWSEGLTFDK